MKISAAIAAAALLGTAAPALAQTYDPVVQGPSAANFVFGFDAGSGFTPYATSSFQTSGCPIAGTGCYTGPNTFMGVYFAPTDGTYQGAELRANELTLHPGPSGETVGVRFIAPESRTYSFTGFFRAADAPSGNGTIATTPEGSVDLGLRPASTPFSFRRTLAAGDTADFTVGNNGAFAYDTTGLSLAIAAVPEPATWAMMILGFGVIGGALRSRRRMAVRVAYN